MASPGFCAPSAESPTQNGPRIPTKGEQRVFIDPRRIAAAGRGVDLVVAGHIHRQSVLRARGSTVVGCAAIGLRTVVAL